MCGRGESYSKVPCGAVVLMFNGPKKKVGESWPRGENLKQLNKICHKCERSDRLVYLWQFGMMALFF